MTVSNKFLEELSQCIKNRLINTETELLKLKNRLKDKQIEINFLEDNNELTYKTLYKHLIKTKYNNIKEFMKKYSYEQQKKFEPQESIFRLFSILKLFDINVGENILSYNYEVSSSNFSLGQLEKIDNLEKYKKAMKSRLKDKGDISDLTFISNDDKEIVICSSKNFNKAHTKFDIDEIYEVYFNKFRDYKINIILIVPDKNELNKAIDRMLDSSSTIRELLRKTTKIDWNDLNDAYLLFKTKYYTEKIPKIFPEMEKNELKLYLNQRYSVKKVLEIIKTEEKQKILLGQKPRSGKTYIMSGIIAEDIKDTTKNLYIIVTPVPSETKQQYKDAFKFKNFENCKILDLTNETLSKTKDIKKDNLIILVSKQYLGIRDEEDEDDENFDKKKKFFRDILKSYNHRITFLDEVHYGVTTEQSKDILKDYKLNNSHLIFVTATYDKAINSYKINKENFVLWDLDDENMCKTIDFNTEMKKERLKEKHGEIFEELLKEYTDEQIVKQYQKAPDIKLWQMKLDDITRFIISNNDKIEKTSFPPGFSTTALFTVRNMECKTSNCEFLYENSVIKFTEMLFGKKSYYNEIYEYCKTNNSRRYTKETPGTIMMFLPESNVNVISYALKNVIEKVTDEFEILIINNKNEEENKNIYGSNNVKDIINNALKKIKNKKSGVIVLLGKQASIGVTIESCDIVILADGGVTNRDMTIQRMFRSGSDGENKKFGFVVDTNYHRIFNYIGDLANTIRTTNTTESSIKYILDTNLVEFCNDDWIETVFKKKEITDEELVNMIYSKYLESNNIKTIIDQIKTDDDEILVSLIKDINITKSGIDKIDKKEEKGVKRLKEQLGEKIRELIDDTDEDYEDIDIENIYEKIKAFKEIIEYMLPLIVLFSKVKEYNININVITEFKRRSEYVYNKLLDEISKSWFKGKMDSKTEKILNTYINMIEEQDNINVINDLNKIFETKDKIKLYNNIEQNIKKTLVNRIEEADITTPSTLVNEMLDKLPSDVWKDKYLTWFDPAVGRGAFIMEVYNRLMIGLKDQIKNDDNRSDYIIKRMLYMSELNVINIEIIKSLLYEKNLNININYSKNTKKNFLKIYSNKEDKLFYELDVMEGIDKIKKKNENVNRKNNYKLTQSDELVDKLSDLIIKEEDDNDIIKEFKKLNIDNKKIINEYLELKTGIREKEKKQFGEVFTPRGLINGMLDTLPKDVWKNKNLKWFDPAVGIGNFMIEIYYRLMEGLIEEIPDFYERKMHIVNNMLYMSELNPENIMECKRVFDNKCNIYEGDTLEIPKDYFGKNKFDIIVGNPPYQKQLGTTNRLAIWPLFVEYSLDNLNNNGYLLFVHPSGWRNPDGNFRNIYKRLVDNNLIYLNMNDTKKGQEIFKAGTNFDFYLLRNNSEYKTTRVIDIDDNEYNIDLKELEFIPSGKFNDFKKLLSKNKEEKIELMHSSLYHTQRKYISKKKTEVYKYPIIYTITKDKINYYYSSEKKGQFDIPKVIWSNGMGTRVIKDEKGEYGITEFAHAIVDKVENLENIKNAMNSKKFIELMKYVRITTSHKYNHKVISLFKKDFYKEFI